MGVTLLFDSWAMFKRKCAARGRKRFRLRQRLRFFTDLQLHPWWILGKNGAISAIGPLRFLKNG